MLRFLIDECVSPLLAGLAREQGFDATHVNWVRLNRTRDQIISVFAVAEDYVLVTNNAVDYRPIYRALDVHPGLVIILPSVRRTEQLGLFAVVLDRLNRERDLVNKLVEIDRDERVTISDFPPFASNL